MTTENHLQNIKKKRLNTKILFAISFIKNAECEEDVLEAIYLKEEISWHEWSPELQDQWNEYYGDAKKYLP